MNHLSSLVDKLRPDRFVPSTAIFPDIQVETLAKDLRVEQRGRQRGEKDLPSPDDEKLDVVENEIVAALNERRRKALNNYEEHLQTYSRRLREAHSARSELKTISGVSKTDFSKAVLDWENHLTNARRRVSELYWEMENFRKENGITRTARSKSSLLLFLGIAIALIVIESASNGYFFAQGNELGLLGGSIVAFAVSVLNVSTLIICGYFSTNVVHRRFIRKSLGFLAIVFAIVFALGFNLSVAQFRDAAGYLVWNEAVREALEVLTTDPLGLRSIESWLLVGIGLLICFVSFWKGATYDDPYPGYGHLSRRLENAREDYAHQISQALEDVEELRDKAVDELNEARREISAGLNEAIDVIYARRGLREQCGIFLEHAEQAANQLLGIYREANRQARSAPAPKHFGKPFTFEKFSDRDAPDQRDRETVEKDLDAMNKVIDETISDIFDECARAQKSFPKIGELESKQNAEKDWAHVS